MACFQRTIVLFVAAILIVNAALGEALLASVTRERIHYSLALIAYNLGLAWALVAGTRQEASPRVLGRLAAFALLLTLYLKVWVDWSSYSVLAVNLEVLALAASILYLLKGRRARMGIPLAAASLAGLYLVLWPVILYTRGPREFGLDALITLIVFPPLLASYLIMDLRVEARVSTLLSLVSLVAGVAVFAARAAGLVGGLVLNLSATTLGAAAFYVSAVALLLEAGAMVRSAAT